MTEIKHDPLVERMDEMENALATDWKDHEAVWISRVRQSLTSLQDALRQHPTPNDNEMLEDIEPQQREFSPGLARKVRGLRKDQKQILQEVGALRAMLERNPTEASIASVRQCAVDLLKDVRELVESQNRVAMDTLMRDNGVGE